MPSTMIWRAAMAIAISPDAHCRSTVCAATVAGAPAPRTAPAPANVGSKKLSNARLRASGFTLQWPDSRLGYAALLAEARPPQA